MKKYRLKRGIFIAIEGVDGAGKTTQVYRLKDYYNRKGYQITTLKEPTEGQYGKQIRILAQNGRHLVTPEEEMKLFLNDREEDCKFNIIPALQRKEIVIIDRYYYSNIAYQGALGLDAKMIQRENELIAVRPDLVIILDCAVRIGLSRITNLRGEEPNHFEKEDYLEKVRRNFLLMKDSNIQIIDSSRPEDEVFFHVNNIVRDLLSPVTEIYSDQEELFSANQSQKYRFTTN